MSLYVGNLAGDAFKVINSGTPVSASGGVAGPVGDLVVVTWMDSTGLRRIDLVDTADGKLTTIANSADIPGLGLGAIDPSGSFIYWSTFAKDGTMDGFWQRPVAGGEPKMVLGNSDGPAFEFDFSLDGKYIVFSNWSEHVEGWDYHVYDADFNLVGELLDSGHGQVVGFLGDQLVVYAEGGHDVALEFPLLGIDLTGWSAKELVSSEGLRAAILPAADGSPVLVFDGHDGQGRYTVSMLGTAGSPRTIYTGGKPWDDPPAALVRSGTTYGVAVSGWVAVFPGGRALTTADLSGGGQAARRLIRISDGEVIEIAPPTIQP